MKNLYRRLVCLSFYVLLSQCVSAGQVLIPYQSLATTAARGITPFTIKGEHYLAVPQLAKDDLSSPARMNIGDADTDVLIYKWQDKKFKSFQHLDGHGNEDTEFFMIGNRAFLAVASIHAGKKPPYQFKTDSRLYEWNGKQFTLMQSFNGFAAKKWTAFTIGKDHFLVLACGVVPEKNVAKAIPDTSSTLYKWNGKTFIPFQTFKTLWSYGFFSFRVGNHDFLAVADHAQASVIYRWDGKHFVEWQRMNDDGGGRSFTHFQINGADYLAYANIQSGSVILKWDGKRFVTFQALPGAGGREFAFFTDKGQAYLFRINFITGSRDNPKTVLSSPLYRWQNQHFETVQTITTYGGVDAETFSVDKHLFLGVANSINQALRYRVDSVIYQVH